MTARTIKTMYDIPKLTADEFVRFIPDLIAWHSVAHSIAELADCPVDDLNVNALIWTDDGRPGVVTSIKLGDQELLEQPIAKDTNDNP
ncbi:hypothetical protein [Comamonas sp. MYb69]|uniref:hypothetical protein n=1 Tax=Comamonas sp. MYb69 TaxID=1848650 RepID=UPI0030A5DBE4